jgi:hypothetical protein
MAMTKVQNQTFLMKKSGNAVFWGFLLFQSVAWADLSGRGSQQVSSETVKLERVDVASEAVDEVCGDEAETDSWLDRSYSYLNERLCAPAVWFDGFFGDPRTLEENPVNSFIRVRSALGWDQDGGANGGLQVRANLVLPRVSDRIRLLVARDEDVSGEGLSALGLDDDNAKTRLGLRFILGEEFGGLTDIDATVRVKSGSLNPRLSSRYRSIHRLGEHGLFRGTQTLFWEQVDGWGTQSRIDLEWVPKAGRLVRWTNRGTFSEASSGVDWRSVWLMYQQLDRKTALRLDAGGDGWTRPDFTVDEYFVALRLRRQFLRPWLFFEVQPERAWPLEPFTQNRRGDWRLTFTFEVQFENQPVGHNRRWNIER